MGCGGHVGGCAWSELGRRQPVDASTRVFAICSAFAKWDLARPFATYSGGETLPRESSGAAEARMMTPL
jgi:hypothetical protein